MIAASSDGVSHATTPRAAALRTSPASHATPRRRAENIGGQGNRPLRTQTPVQLSISKVRDNNFNNFRQHRKAICAYGGGRLTGNSLIRHAHVRRPSGIRLNASQQQHFNNFCQHQYCYQ